MTAWKPRLRPELLEELIRRLHPHVGSARKSKILKRRTTLHAQSLRGSMACRTCPSPEASGPEGAANCRSQRFSRLDMLRLFCRFPARTSNLVRLSKSLVSRQLAEQMGHTTARCRPLQACFASCCSALLAEGGILQLARPKHREGLKCNGRRRRLSA